MPMLCADADADAGFWEEEQCLFQSQASSCDGNESVTELLHTAKSTGDVPQTKKLKLLQHPTNSQSAWITPVPSGARVANAGAHKSRPPAGHPTNLSMTYQFTSSLANYP